MNKFCQLGFTIVFFNCLSGVSFAQTPTPNIVFFLADDMGIGDTSAYQDLTGNSDAYQVNTPNMKRLAQMGLRFTDFHSGASVCTPTRLSLLTGTHAFRGVARQLTSRVSQDTIATLFPGTRRTLAHMLQDAGYGTYGIGKWHTGMQVTDIDAPTAGSEEIHEGPIECGFSGYTGLPGNFQTSVGMMQDNDLVTFTSVYSALVPTGSPGGLAPVNPPDEAYLRHITQAQLDAARGYLIDHVANRSEDPFFLYYASQANHTPYLPARDSNDTGPTAAASLDGIALTGNTVAGSYLDVPTDANGNPTGPDYDEIDLVNHWGGDNYNYLSTDGNGDFLTHGPGERFKIIQENDVVLGRLLEYLEATDDPRNPGHKLIDNTLVVFTSDNGSDIKSEPSVGALPQPGNESVIADIKGKKATPDEGGTRVPFIAAWGNQISGGGTSNALFGTNDIYATLAELAGQELSPTEAVDSESVVDALLGNVNGNFRDTDLVYKNRDRLIIRRGNLKLIAEDPDADRNGSRFDGNLDFVGMYVRDFYDLGVDLSESQDLLKTDGTFRNATDQATYEATMQNMLQTLQSYVDAGVTRNGAVAVPFGKNFQGGDLLSAGAYSSYAELNADPGGPDFEPNVLTLDTPGFVFVDGAAANKFNGAWMIHGNGTASLTGNQSGLDNGSIYEMRGGTIDATAAGVFRVDNGSTLVVNGRDASIDATGKDLRFQQGVGLVEFKEGEITADRLVFNSDSGIFRFGKDAGIGLLTLDNVVPIVINSSGTENYIDFESDAEAMLVSNLDAADFGSLWDNNRLRVDGLGGGQRQAAGGTADFSSFFTVEPSASQPGFHVLHLNTSTIPDPDVLLGDCNQDGIVSFLDISPFISILSAGGYLAEADVNEDGTVSFLDIGPFIGLLSL